MNSYLERHYWVVKTKTNDAIGLVTMVCPMADANSCLFSLLHSQHMHTHGEFMDLVGESLDFSEFETHRDAFKTLEELDVVDKWLTSSGTAYNILVRKKEDGNTDTSTS